MIGRRRFLALFGFAPAAVAARRAEAYVPLPNGRSIHVDVGNPEIVVHGAVDAAEVKAMIEASNQKMREDLQRHFGRTSAKWNQRHGR